MTTDLRESVAARLDGLLARLGELADAEPAREVAPVPGDLQMGPIDAAPQGWPEGQPCHLTARQALDTVAAAQFDAAAWFESDIRAAVAWLVAPDLVDDVLAHAELAAEWRWPWMTVHVGNGPDACGPSYGWRLALGRLLRSWVAGLPLADAGRWPAPGVTRREVATWARPMLIPRHPWRHVDPRSVYGTSRIARDQGLWDGSGELSAELAAAAYGLTLDEWRKEFPSVLAQGDELAEQIEMWGKLPSVPVAGELTACRSRSTGRCLPCCA